MILLIKKKMVITVALLLAVAFFSLGTVGLVYALSPKPQYCVVLDAGHGGIDNGVVGINSGVFEADINLSICKKIETLLLQQNIAVILTRNDKNGLYGAATQNFKQKDMDARKKIINKAAPNAVVSVHCNKFPQKTRRGAQVFFNAASPLGANLARAVQAPLNTLNNRELAKPYTALKGDYYILNCSKAPSCIVECGFLSNLEDDKLLTSDSYQNELSYAIFSGIIGFLSLNVPSFYVEQ